MAGLSFEGVSKRFGDTAAVSDLTFAARDGELFAVLGPSGCGKTTALRIAAGFVTADAGRVRLDGRDVTDLAPERRGAAMVFQSYALFPHLDVGENVAFGLRARHAERAAIPARVAEALARVDLKGYERRDVSSLSGGEQQRVALARAIVVEPSILLLDEPMSNLDPRLRASTRRDLRALQRRLGITAIHVTHDQEEALELADRVAVLERGRLVQVGTPRELYDRPASAFVATFVGAANVLEATVRGTNGALLVLELAGGRTVQAEGPARPPGSKVKIAVRPESLVIGAAGEGGEALGEGTVRAVEFLGPTLELAVALEGGPELRVVVLNGAPHGPVPGERLQLGVPRERLVVLADGE